MVIDECGNCEKMKTKITHRVNFEDGYLDFCSKKCAKQSIIRNINGFIYKCN